MENSSQTRNTAIPRFFQTSCRGRGVENHREKEIASGSAMVQQHWPAVGGITCCVPNCFNNSLRNPELSYYVNRMGAVRKSKNYGKDGCICYLGRTFIPDLDTECIRNTSLGGKDLHEQCAYSGPKK